VYHRVADTVENFRLNTVCGGARCPNRADCWGGGHLAFQILGTVCTRACGFCGEKRGRPLPPDSEEAERLAEAVKRLDLKYVVLTSPARDDLPDGGSSHFISCIRRLRNVRPGVRVEVLVCDFRGNFRALERLCSERPDVFNHNLETVRRLTPSVRSAAVYERSLEVLRAAAGRGLLIKSGLMVGLGETWEEILSAFRDLRASGCCLLTVGQYLAPSAGHLPVKKFYMMEEFHKLRDSALEMGFEKVFCGPLVRSSYRAEAAAPPAHPGPLSSSRPSGASIVPELCEGAAEGVT